LNNEIITIAECRNQQQTGNRSSPHLLKLSTLDYTSTDIFTRYTNSDLLALKGSQERYVKNFVKYTFDHGIVFEYHENHYYKEDQLSFKDWCTVDGNKTTTPFAFRLVIIIENIFNSHAKSDLSALKDEILLSMTGSLFGTFNPSISSKSAYSKDLLITSITADSTFPKILQINSVHLNNQNFHKAKLYNSLLTSNLMMFILFSV
jgi:hypothetical protein